MAPSTPSPGLPSPPLRTPNTPSRVFPYTFIPHLPKVGTAKVRLRSNVLALCAYIAVWWQSSLYALFKASIVLMIGAIISNQTILKVFSWLGALHALFFSNSPVEVHTCRERFALRNPMEHNGSYICHQPCPTTRIHSPFSRCAFKLNTATARLRSTIPHRLRMSL